MNPTKASVCSTLTCTAEPEQYRRQGRYTFSMGGARKSTRSHGLQQGRGTLVEAAAADRYAYVGA